MFDVLYSLVLMVSGGQLQAVLPDAVPLGVGHRVARPAPAVEGPDQVHCTSRFQVERVRISPGGKQRLAECKLV